MLECYYTHENSNASFEFILMKGHRYWSAADKEKAEEQQKEDTEKEVIVIAGAPQKCKNSFFFLLFKTQLCVWVFFFPFNVSPTCINMQRCFSPLCLHLPQWQECFCVLEREEQKTDSDRWSTEGSEILSGSCRGCVRVCVHVWAQTVCLYVCCNSLRVISDDLWRCGSSTNVSTTQIAGFIHAASLQLSTGEASAGLQAPPLSSLHSPSPSCPPAPLDLPAPESLANQTPN